MSIRRTDDAGLTARVTRYAVKGARTVSELAADFGVHPTMSHTWKEAPLEGASDILERGGTKKAAVDKETVPELPAKLGELVAANDFLAKKLIAWTGQ